MGKRGRRHVGPGPTSVASARAVPRLPATAAVDQPPALADAVAAMERFEFRGRGLRLTRDATERGISDWVRQGRQAGVSWRELGRILAVPGETLRRRYGAIDTDPAGTESLWDEA